MNFEIELFDHTHMQRKNAYRIMAEDMDAKCDGHHNFASISSFSLLKSDRKYHAGHYGEA